MPEGGALVGSRRSVIKLAAAAGLALGIGPGASGQGARAAGLEPAPWLRVGRDGRVTILLGPSEMGQDVGTMAAILVAEEMDLPLDRVTVEQAPADPERYGLNGRQATGGSFSARSMWEPMRRVGAAARAMLVAAAARRWGVAEDALRTQDGQVLDPANGRRLDYAALVEAAALLPVPASARTKDARDYRLIGRDAHRRDALAKTNGTVRYGIDTRVPGMKVAAIVTSPKVGARLIDVDEAAALRLAGVRGIVRLDDAVAVIADKSWYALAAARALKVRWGPGQAAASQAEVERGLAAASAAPGAIAVHNGEPDELIAASPKRVEAAYRQSFLAHAAMEPLNCTVAVTPGRCEIWTGTQIPGPARDAVAKALGLPVEAVVLHNITIGGGFGRRLEPDYVLRAVEVARRVPFPIKLLWSREEDFRQDYFRPAYLDTLAAALDEEGRPAAWTHKIAGSSVFARQSAAMFKDGVDLGAIQAAIDTPYRLPVRSLSYHRAECGMRTGSWRGVGRARTLFPVESFIDELAHAAGVDPLDYRRRLIDQPRLLRVLDLAAERAGWGCALPKGEGLGLSALWGFGSFVAQVVHVAVQPEKPLRIVKVVAAIDCGRAINPDGIRAQMQGGVLFGLSAALGEAATLADGEVAQTNFDSYQLLRIDGAPPVEVHIVPSEESPAGVGEAGVPGIAPALANAIFAASGRRIRDLPLTRSGLWPSIT